ncbi:MAG: AI-2E family transporter, partial [Thermomicrobiales bacterium]|nr:AI-2E family transporter [Thermomicrobiales bacterium]
MSEPTPIVIDRRTRNVLVTLAFIVLVALFWFAPAAARVAGGGVALAVILSFPVRLLSRWAPRPLAIAVVMLLLLLAATLAVVVLVPLVVAQLAALVAAIPDFAGRAYDELQHLLTFLGNHGLLETTPEETLQNLQRQAITHTQAIGQEILAQTLSTFTSAFGLMLTLVGVIFVTIYLLTDTERIKRRLIRSFPLVYRDDMESLWNEAGESLSRYLVALLISS